MTTPDTTTRDVTTRDRKGRHPMIVALTGGIASGKTEAAKRFVELGVSVIDADDVTRRLVEPGTPALVEIVETFGTGVLDRDGRLDRAQMRSRVFESDDDRRTLERILHPKVRRAMREFAESCDAPYVLFVIPLLVETNRAHEMDRVVVVDAPRALRAARAAARDGSPPETIAAVIDSQATRRERLAAADVIIENSGDLARLRMRVDQVHRECLALAEAAATVKESCNGRAQSGPTESA